ncbi:hypothetical protein [Budvicia aquatica]|uniref:hypothetical protein n=1 Tax=Budvicia aquatica TaxID=82979 RepID=UPI001069D8EB|nr:hypothetical protein [Budvicia aquatica]
MAFITQFSQAQENAMRFSAALTHSESGFFANLNTIKAGTIFRMQTFLHRLNLLDIRILVQTIARRITLTSCSKSLTF